MHFSSRLRRFYLIVKNLRIRSVAATGSYCLSLATTCSAASSFEASLSRIIIVGASRPSSSITLGFLDCSICRSPMDDYFLLGEYVLGTWKFLSFDCSFRTYCVHELRPNWNRTSPSLPRPAFSIAIFKAFASVSSSSIGMSCFSRPVVIRTVSTG